MFSTEQNTDKISFLGQNLSPEQASAWQWVLLGLFFVMLLVAFVLAYRLFVMEKQSLEPKESETKSRSDRKSTNTGKDTDSKAYFLGIAMEPHQVLQRQWLLMAFCLSLILCLVSLVIWMMTYHSRTPPWMKANWWSWD